jgi:hypothetical protein
MIRRCGTKPIVLLLHKISQHNLKFIHRNIRLRKIPESKLIKIENRVEQKTTCVSASGFLKFAVINPDSKNRYLSLFSGFNVTQPFGRLTSYFFTFSFLNAYAPPTSAMSDNPPSIGA